MRYILLLLPIVVFGQSITLNPANPVATEGTSVTITADRPVTFQLTGAGSISVQNDHTITYTAPSKLTQTHVVSGCMAAPADSVFNTRIDSLPVSPNSAAWTPNLSTVGIAAIYQWGTNLVDNSASFIPQYFHYTTSLNGTPFPVLPDSKRRREGGSYTTDGGNDHHLLTINHQGCTFYETYQDNVPVSGCSNCTAASGVTYPSTNYSEFPASTDAAALPLAPLTVHLDEIESGTIKHAMRFTTCAGCVSQTVLWPAAYSTGWSPSGAPMGARFRLKSSFDVSSYPPAAQVVLTALKQYGMILADIGMEGQISFNSDVTRDTTVVNALNTLSSVGADDFEVVDESSLMLNESLNTVNPANRYVKPVNSAILTVVDKANAANVAKLPIALQTVTVGTTDPALTVQAGTNTFPIQTWVNGSSNQNVTWSISPSFGAGSIDSHGNYTAPALVSGATKATLIAKSQADSSASVRIALTVVPNGPLMIDTGSQTNTVDSSGNNWLADIGFETGSYSDQNDNYPTNAWGGIANQTQYETYKYTWGEDIVYRLHVPNGNYKVTLMFGQGGTNGEYNTGQFDNGLIIGPMNLESQGQITNHMWDLGIPTNYTGRTPATAVLPAQVTDTTLVVAVRATTTTVGHSAPFLNGITVVPDTDAPSITVDSQRHIVLPGQSLQLYATDWFNNSQNMTWRIVSGPGTISSTGQYFAPLRIVTGQIVTVRARDSVTGLSTTYNLYVPTPGQPIPAGMY